MDTTVTMYGFAKYGTAIVVLLFLLVIAIGILYLFFLSKSKKEVLDAQNPNKKLKIEEPAPSVKQRIINRYSKDIGNIQFEYINKKMSGREAYQELSKEIRKFAREMTGVDISVYTLEEIKMLKFPVLEELIENCYQPEFSSEHENDADKTIEKTIERTLKVMKKWK